MSFGHRTPESLLVRSDSKDPATTCRGLTSAGRPCRRPLAANATKSSTGTLPTNRSGVIAVLNAGDAAAFFCWQHQDQADVLVKESSRQAQVLPLNQRSSIDTLVEKFGMVELGDNRRAGVEQETSHQQPYPTRDKQRRNTDRLGAQTTRPQGWQRVQEPLTTVPESRAESRAYRRPQQASKPPRRHTPERPSRPTTKTSWFCCTVPDDDDELPATRRSEYRHGTQHASANQRHRPRPLSDQMTSLPRREHHTRHTSLSTQHKQVSEPSTTRMSSSTVVYPQLAPITSHSGVASTPTRPSLQPRAASSPPNPQTTTYLSLIPPHLSPSTTSALLAELSKQISPADESGYIYIFWLTPESDVSKPDDETVSSLLDPDDFLHTLPSSRHGSTITGGPRSSHERATDRRMQRTALTAHALQRFASVKHGPNSAEPNKILLKIGRANNVHRRLSQWTKQCGQNITLIRYYPYHPQTRAEQPRNREMTMVPHVHRVERLIHLELADQRVVEKGQCDQCGRRHKEWFEVEATREGVRAVDEVVRRWVGWAQTTEAYG